MTKISIRYYSRSKKKCGLIPIGVSVIYDSKRIRTSISTPELTTEEFALIDSAGIIKNPLPPTNLSNEEIKHLQERMLNNRAFWVAVVDTFTEYGGNWRDIDSQDLDIYISGNFDEITARALKYRKIGRCK